MSHDIEGVVVSDKWTEIKSRHILNAVFGTNTLSEIFVGSYAVTKFLNLADEVGMRLAEFLTTFLITRIDDCAISEDQSCTHHHPVTVGMDATVHSRGVVANDTAHHCTTYRGWVGWEHSSKGFQYLVNP